MRNGKDEIKAMFRDCMQFSLSETSEVLKSRHILQMRLMMVILNSFRKYITVTRSLGLTNTDVSQSLEEEKKKS